MSKRRLIPLITICFIVVFGESGSNAHSIPYAMGTIENFLGNATYFNGYSARITSFDFAGTWQYTAIATEAGNRNITEDPTGTEATYTFNNASTSNWGIWRPINFETGNIYFTDTTDGPRNVPVDSYAYHSTGANYFALYQLTADSKNLGYLNHPLTLSAGTYILGFNDNKKYQSNDSDFDDLIIAIQPVPQPVPEHSIPEPATVLLLGIGLMGVAGASRIKTSRGKPSNT